MSVTTTQCRPVKVLKLKLKNPLEKVPEVTSKSSKSDVVSDVSEITGVNELVAALEKLEIEKEYVHETRKKFYSIDKLSISQKAFKDVASSTNTAAIVKKCVDKTSSCFRQYSDCFNDLYVAVADEYIKLEKQTKVTNLVECSNEQEDKKDSESSDDAAKPLFISFSINLGGIKDHHKLHNFSRYCRELARRFLNFKKNFDSLPSDFDMAEYRRWEQKMLDVLYCEISIYSAQFKLKEEVASSEKMKLYLESTSSLLSKLVSNLPFGDSENMEAKRKLAENFACSFEAIGTLLKRLHQPLSKFALKVAAGKKQTSEHAERLTSYMEDVYNFVRYFKTLLHGDFPCYDDIIRWAYDLRNCVFEMCGCETCPSSAYETYFS